MRHSFAAIAGCVRGVDGRNINFGIAMDETMAELLKK
jgi:hypothetical protein